MALSQLLKSEIAKTESDPNSLLFNGMPETEDTFLAGRLANDYAKYEELEDDSQISSLLQARKLAPVSREYVINPGGDSKDDIKIADLVRDIFSSHISLDMLTIDMLDALMKGNQVGEIMWDVDSKTYFPDRILTRAQGRFGFARPKSDSKLKAALAWGAKTLLAPPPDNELKRLGVGTVDGYEIRLLDRYPLYGENVPDKKFIVHHVGSKNSNPKGKGFGSKLWWLVQFKREAAKFWLIFLDKFASPTPYGTYPPNGSKHELEQFLERITQGMWAAFPQGYTVAMLEASRSGSIEAYEGFINRYCNREMAKVILGQFYLGESQGLSGAPANNDETIRAEIAKADADMVSNTLNQTLMRWLTEFNAPAGTKPPTIWRVFPEHVDLNARVSRDKSLFDMGHRLTSAAVKEIYGEGYVDTSLTKLEEGKDNKLPLITTLGDTGMNALIGFVKEAAGGAVPKENAIAIMQAVFGVDPKDAAKMLPDPQPTEEDEIGSILGGSDEEAAPEETPEPAPEELPAEEPAPAPTPEPVAALHEATKPAVATFAAPSPNATKIRVFLDTEFNEDGRTIDLISIGLATEDGRKYYAISSEFDESRVSDWVRENVIAKLEPPDVVPRKPRAQIRDEIVAFMGGQIPEFWAFYATSDWVALYQLFGRLIDLPPGWPMICYDLKQLQKHLGIDNKEFPPKPRNQHNALADAEWNLASWQVLERFADSGSTVQLQEPPDFSGLQSAITELAQRVDQLNDFIQTPTPIPQAQSCPQHVRPTTPLPAANFRDWGKAKREKLAEGDIKGGFAGPNQTYPVSNAEDVKNAWNLAGRATNPDQVRRNVIKLAKKLKLTQALPAAAKTWADDHDVELSELEQVQQLCMKLQTPEFSEPGFTDTELNFMQSLGAEIRQREQACQLKHQELQQAQAVLDRLDSVGFNFADLLLIQQAIQMGESNV